CHNLFAGAVDRNDLSAYDQICQNLPDDPCYTWPNPSYCSYVEISGQSLKACKPIPESQNVGHRAACAKLKAALPEASAPGGIGTKTTLLYQNHNCTSWPVALIDTGDVTALKIACA